MIMKVTVDGLHELGAGHIYCQLVNSYHLKTINESLINMCPKNSHEYIHNLRLFQLAMARLKCKRRVEVNGLLLRLIN